MSSLARIKKGAECVAEPPRMGPLRWDPTQAVARRLRRNMCHLGRLLRGPKISHLLLHTRLVSSHYFSCSI